MEVRSAGLADRYVVEFAGPDLDALPDVDTEALLEDHSVVFKADRLLPLNLESALLNWAIVFRRRAGQS